MLLKWALEGRRKRAQVANNPKSQRPSGSRNPSSFTSDSSNLQSPHDHLSSELIRLEFAHRAAFESSAESAGARAIRHQEAEEKAISLRDDALIESGEDPKTRLGRGLSDEGHHHDAEADALTAENMQKFSQSDRMEALKREESVADADASSVGATLGESQSTGCISRVSTHNTSAEGRKGG